PSQAVRAEGASGAPARDPAPAGVGSRLEGPALRPARDRSRRAHGARRWPRAQPHGSSVFADRGARRERGSCALSRGVDGPRQGRCPRNVRPLDRRPCVPHPSGDRGRSEAPPPHPDRARRRLCVREAAGLMRRLYLRIYLAVLVSLAAFAVVSGALWHSFGYAGPAGRAVEVAGTLAQNVLPPAGAPDGEEQAALEKLAANLRADVALFAA